MSRQETALSHEGVQVVRGALGERSIDFSEYGWFPEILPSEAAEEATPAAHADESG